MSTSFTPGRLIKQAFYHLTSQEGEVQYNKVFWEREHISFITVYCYNCSILIWSLLLTSTILVYALTLSQVCICGKNLVYLGFHTAHGSRHSVGSLEHIPQGGGGYFTRKRDARTMMIEWIMSVVWLSSRLKDVRSVQIPMVWVKLTGAGVTPLVIQD